MPYGVVMWTIMSILGHQFGIWIICFITYKECGFGSSLSNDEKLQLVTV